MKQRQKAYIEVELLAHNFLAKSHILQTQSSYRFFKYLILQKRNRFIPQKAKIYKKEYELITFMEIYYVIITILVLH